MSPLTPQPVFLGCAPETHKGGLGFKSLSSTQDPWPLLFFLYHGLDSGLDQGPFQSQACLSGEQDSLTVAILILITTTITVTG